MDTEDKQPELVSPVRRRPRVQQQDSVESSVSAEESVFIPPDLAHWIKLRAKELKIRQKDRSWAAEVVNDFRENLLRFLRSNSDQPVFQTADFLTTGSYFEKVKIHSPDEFDMMLKIQVPCRFNTTKLDAGLFYRVDLTRPTRTPIKDFLLDNELTLSSSKILAEMFRLVRKFLRTYRGPLLSPYSHLCCHRLGHLVLLGPYAVCWLLLITFFVSSLSARWWAWLYCCYAARWSQV